MNAFIIFWLAACIGAAAVLPYQFKMLKGTIEEDKRKNPHKKVPSNSVLMLISFFQSAVLLGIASYIGTRFAPKVDLHWWLVDNWLHGTEIPYSLPVIGLIAALAGLAVALIIIILDTALMKRMPKVHIDFPSRKQSLLASLYGSISEEVLVRLFVMTMIVYLTSFLGLEDGAYWIGIVLAAILFGVGHLPAAFQLFGKSKFVAMRTISLNAIPGLLFGYLYWQYGIEIAMISHFAGDIGLHVIFGPMVRAKDSNKDLSIV